MKNILISICARKGSKGIPRKNVKLLNKIPLIVYSIELAKLFKEKHSAHIAISTDSQEIIKISKECGIDVDYIRPNFLSGDDVSKIETIKNLLIFEENKLSLKFDYIIDLDVTSPLRNLNDLENAFSKFKNNNKILTLFSVSKSNRNPYFNVVEKNNLTGYFECVKKPPKSINSRQKAPIVYDMNASFYFYRRDFFNQNYTSPITEKSEIFLVDHICFDIDNELDFIFMEYLIEHNKLDFIL